MDNSQLGYMHIQFKDSVVGASKKRGGIFLLAPVD